MKTIDQLLQKELELLADELVQAYNAKGMRASGNWERELKIEVGNNVGKITGVNYSEQLEYGRRGGKFPPIDVIEQWIQDKGITPIEQNMTDRTLAFLIARKISREGWKREGFGGVELLSEVVTPKRLQEAIQRITPDITQDIVIDITNEFQKQFS